MAAKKLPNELYLTRVYDAPVKTVWDAWVDPEQVAKWWGPRGFTLTTHSKDVRTGGTWDYTMHGPDGTDYPNLTKYHEVEKYQRMVYDHGGSRDRPPLFRVTVLFTEIDGQTKLDMTMHFPDAEAAENIRKFIKSAGGDGTWDRLAEFLENASSGKNIFVINRSFAAPIDLVFEMWTNPEHITKWSGPAGSEMMFIRAEVKKGGKTFYKMSNKENLTLYGGATYLQIDRPHRLVYTQQFFDEHENVSRHPLAPTWPETMLTTVMFTAEGEHQTRVTVRWEPYGKVSAEEIAIFTAARGGMTQGWTGSFDKLESVLAN